MLSSGVEIHLFSILHGMSAGRILLSDDTTAFLIFCITSEEKSNLLHSLERCPVVDMRQGRHVAKLAVPLLLLNCRQHVAFAEAAPSIKLLASSRDGGVFNG